MTLPPTDGAPASSYWGKDITGPELFHEVIWPPGHPISEGGYAADLDAWGDPVVAVWAWRDRVHVQLDHVFVSGQMQLTRTVRELDLGPSDLDLGPEHLEPLLLPWLGPDACGRLLAALGHPGTPHAPHKDSAADR